jgi:hypothetical protein
VGALASRAKLERRRYAETGSRAHTDGTLSGYSASDYTGLLLALVGTAAAIGEWRGVLAVICALAGILWKIRVEEERMRQTFAEYEQYRKGTAALIPPLY